MKKRIYIISIFFIFSFTLCLTAQNNIVDCPPISEIEVKRGSVGGCGLINRRTGETILPVTKEYRIKCDYITKTPSEYSNNLIKVEYQNSQGIPVGSGYINTLGKKVSVGFKYFDVGPIINGKIIVKEGQPNYESGIIDFNGKVILPTDYTKISNCELYPEYYSVGKVISSKTSDNQTIRNELFAIYDSNGKQIFPFKYQSAKAIGANLFLVCKGRYTDRYGETNNWGVIDSVGNIIVDFSDEVRINCDKVLDRIIITKVNSKYVESYIILKEDGTKVNDQLTTMLQKIYSQGGSLTKPDYIIQDDHYEMYDGKNSGIVQVSENGITQKVPQNHKHFDSYRNIFIKCWGNTKTIITDLDYNVIYDSESTSNPNINRLFLANEEFLLMYPKVYNREGKIVYSMENKSEAHLYSDIIATRKGQKTSEEYEYVSMRAPEKKTKGSGFSRVAPNLVAIEKMKGKIKKYAFFDNELNQLSDFIYDAFLHATDNRLPVKKDGKMGVLDLKLKEVAPFNYRRVYGFYNGIAGYESENGCGWIDTTGKVVRYLSESYPENVFVDPRLDRSANNVILTSIRNGRDSVIAINPQTKRFEKLHQVKITEHVSTCKKCAGKGKAIIKTGDQCKSCYGTGGNAKSCANCGGKGTINKVQSVNAITYSSTNLVQTVTNSSTSKCYTCNGVGKYGYCHYCNGVGYTNVQEVEGDCDACNGKGEIVERFTSTLSDD